jgi:hypothetical protein
MKPRPSDSIDLNLEAERVDGHIKLAIATMHKLYHFSISDELLAYANAGRIVEAARKRFGIDSQTDPERARFIKLVGCSAYFQCLCEARDDADEMKRIGLYIESGEHHMRDLKMRDVDSLVRSYYEH